MKKIALITIGLAISSLSGLAQTIQLDDFNSATVSGGPIPLTSWVGVGKVTQNLSTITTNAGVNDDNGWGVFNTTIDATGMNFIAVTASVDALNSAPSFVVEFQDANISSIFTIPTTSFTNMLSTVYIPITSWTVGFTPNAIEAWTIGGGTVGVNAFRMTFDNLALSATGAPVPEPSTYAMIAGVLVLGVVAWRRRECA